MSHYVTTIYGVSTRLTRFTDLYTKFNLSTNSTFNSGLAIASNQIIPGIRHPEDQRLKELSRYKGGTDRSTNRSSEPYDPYTPQAGANQPLRQNSASSDPLNPNSTSKANTKGNTSQRDRIDALHAEVDATKDILHKNIEHMVERGDRLDHLQDRTDELTLQARTFNTTARKTNRLMWWKNMKWTIAVCVLVVIILAGIIGGAVGGSK
ncbi:hypothetical protein I302_100046 [Kwoniella bestiolae CBS 10118]|uniref:V-SNARE coiled-coil homology domain-containing protein n=1 Tax=Kwoniella bestiolae CBS 10118 TaxID=1296100 RepID=A0A1B9G3Y4_9TREE|nr:hypothetical protein I302_03418 [Kwoniella bestiolae CBS 10118]OCF25745.1 hypothetical protein I302_03418 [Kwoniella bestiolae CBS 10118]